VSMLAACGGDDGGSGPTTPPGGTAAELAAEGWTHFEAGRFDDADNSFTEALVQDAHHGPALSGRAWTRLQSAVSVAAMTTVMSYFDSAVGVGEDGADVLIGRAAARLGAGQYASARSDAAAVVAGSATFVFAHRTSVTTNDAHLLLAFAHAAEGNLPAALTASEGIAASGIVEGSPSTWVVGGVTHGTFNSAVLAWLHTQSEGHAG